MNMLKERLIQMDNIHNLEELYGAHILFIYNNLKKSSSFIDGDLVDQIYYRLKNLNRYDKLNIVLQTGGGNLAAGTRLINMLKNSNKKYTFTILDRCNSTGTFVALSSDIINITDKATITPCEPQMFYNGDSISTSIIRNIIDNYNSEIGIMDKISPKILGEYYATINYFKDLCYQVYDKDKACLIIDYMLNRVNSHQYPMSESDLVKLNIEVNNITNNTELTFLEKYSDCLLKEFNDKVDDNIIESRYNLINDCNGTVGYCKRYIKSDNSSKRIFEGYKEIDWRCNNG